MSDEDLDDAVNQAAIAMLGQELRHDIGGDPAANARRLAAAREICRRTGVLDVLRAISAEGELRPPPTWPQADIVPIGGGPARDGKPAFLDCEVRTFKEGSGIRRVTVRIAMDRKPTQDDLLGAYDRGYFELRKLIEAQK
jgi:hypothetical protein